MWRQSYPRRPFRKRNIGLEENLPRGKARELKPAFTVRGGGCRVERIGSRIITRRASAAPRLRSPADAHPGSCDGLPLRVEHRTAETTCIDRRRDVYRSVHLEAAGARRHRGILRSCRIRCRLLAPAPYEQERGRHAKQHETCRTCQGFRDHARILRKPLDPVVRIPLACQTVRGGCAVSVAEGLSQSSLPARRTIREQAHRHPQWAWLDRKGAQAE